MTKENRNNSFSSSQLRRHLLAIWYGLNAVIMKFLSSNCVVLKVERFEGFVNQSNFTHLMIHKTSIRI